jgi:hypothetical protein
MLIVEEGYGYIICLGVNGEVSVSLSLYSVFTPFYNSMTIPDSIYLLISDAFDNSPLPQLAPLFVIFLLPLLALSSRHQLYSVISSLAFMLESLLYVFPWNWGIVYSGHEKHKHKKKYTRTRADLLTENGSVQRGTLEVLA